MNFLSFLKNYINFFSDNRIYYKNLSSLKKKKDILVISHLMNIEGVKEKKDFYFDNISKETNSTIFLINHTKIALKNIKNHNNLAKNIFAQNMGLLTEIKILITLLKESLSILNLLSLKNNLFENKFIINSAAESFSWGSCNALRIGYQINEIVHS